MANLIITIIAIALVAIAALMGAYYGGTAFNSGQDAASATTLMNQGAQIQAAAQIVIATDAAIGDFADITSMTTLSNALGTVPTFRGATWTIVANVASVSSAGITADVCTELGGQVGTTGSTDAWYCRAGALDYTF